MSKWTIALCFIPRRHWLTKSDVSWKSTLFMVYELSAYSVIYARCWNKFNADQVWTTCISTPSVLLNIKEMDKEAGHIVLY